MTKYYIQVVDGLFGEVGYAYIGEENIVTPDGFIPCSNEHANVSYFVVFPSEMVREITQEQYDKIEKDEYGAIMSALDSVGYEKQPEEPRANINVEVARERLADFKRAALELQEVLCELNYYEMEMAGIQDGYPLEQSFDDYDFSTWGEIPKRTPLEDAVLYLDITSHTKKYTTMLESEMNELELFKAVLKALMIRKSRAMSLEEEEEIDRLIENL